MTAYYNENDPFAANWLRALIAAGEIPAGDVDERSIEDVSPIELTAYTQHHFFAGIGGWPYALKLAGWPDDRPVATGSCPCQPYSQAGKRKGVSDERHLWPSMFWHIRQLCPPVIFGEQVASKSSLSWWDLAAHDLESEDYATAAFDLPSASVGAPHRRQRLFWVGHANRTGRQRQRPAQSARRQHTSITSRPNASIMANAQGVLGRKGERRRNSEGCTSIRCISTSGGSERGTVGRVGYSHGQRQQEQRLTVSDAPKDVGLKLSDSGHLEHPAGQRRKKPESVFKRSQQSLSEEIWTGLARTNGEPAPWDCCEWIDCLDGKRRPVKPGIRLLVDGFPGRVAALRGFGNAIVPQVAAEFIQSYMEAVA